MKNNKIFYFNIELQVKTLTNENTLNLNTYNLFSQIMWFHSIRMKEPWIANPWHSSFKSLTFFAWQVVEEPDPISLGVCGVGQPPQGLKRKAETLLGSLPEPGQVLQQKDDDGRGGRYKIRVNDFVFAPALLNFFKN